MISLQPICEICGRLKKVGGHEKCSKIKQKQHAGDRRIHSQGQSTYSNPRKLKAFIKLVDK